MRVKFPLLEQMRADRIRREAEITAPVREALFRGQAAHRQLEETLRVLERAVGSRLAKHVIAEIGHSLSAQLRKQVMLALVKAGAPSFAQLVHLSIPAEVLRFMDAKSMERAILDRYIETLPGLSLRANVELQTRATVLDIRIPQLGFRRVFVDGL